MTKQVQAPEIVVQPSRLHGAGETPAPPVSAPLVPLIEEISGTLDPWDVAQRLAGCAHLLFLDSAGGPSSLARYSYLVADPYAWLQSRGGDIRLNGQVMAGSDPFTVLAEQLDACREEAVSDLPPF